MTDEDEAEKKFRQAMRSVAPQAYSAAMLRNGLASIGARFADTGNRAQRRESQRALRKTPGATWYIPPGTW
jgi:hypothetical protein